MTIRKFSNAYMLLVGLACSLLLAPHAVGQDSVWPQFRGPESNPVAANPKLVDRWSETENVE